MKRKLFWLAAVFLVLSAGLGGAASTIDDFEDGDIQGWSGETSKFSAQQATVLDGIYTGEFTSEDGESNIVRSPSIGDENLDEFHVLARINSTNGGASSKISIENSGGTSLGAIFFDKDTDEIKWYDGDRKTVRSLSADTDYDFDLLIDRTNDEVEIIINGTSQGTYNLENDVAIDNVEMAHNSAIGDPKISFFVDNIIAASQNQQPTFNRNYTVPADPDLNDAVRVESNITDADGDSIAWANMTVWEGSTKIVDNANYSSKSGDIFQWTNFTADETETYNISLTASDGGGTSTSSFNFTISNDAPSISNLNVSPDPVESGNQVNTSADISDSDNNLDQALCSYKYPNGTVAVENVSMSGTGEGARWCTTTPETTGTWTVEIFANDTGGASTSDSTTFEVQDTLTITIHSPENRTYTDTQQPPLEVTASKSVNTWLYNLDDPDFADNQTFQPNTTLPDTGDLSSEKLTVWANDTQGNWANETRYYSVDTNGPLTSDNASSWWQNEQSVQVELTSTDTISDVSNISYRVNGGSWTTDTGSSTIITISSDGNNTVEYNATDSVGNVESTQKTYVLLDDTPPIWQNLQDNTSGSLQELGKTVNISVGWNDTYVGFRETKFAINDSSSFSNESTTTETDLDNFEDNDLSEYSTVSGSASTVSSSDQSANPKHGEYMLDINGDGSNSGVIRSTSGLPYYPERGETFEYWLYSDSSGSTGQESGLSFGVQNSSYRYESEILYDYGSYGIVVEQIQNNSVVDQSISDAITFNQDEWHRFKIDWGSQDINVSVYDSSETFLGNTTLSNTAYDSGGIEWEASSDADMYIDAKSLTANTWNTYEYLWKNSSFEGILGYKVWGRDDFDTWNVTDTETITVDATTPSTTDNYTLQGWQNRDSIAIELTASDNIQTSNISYRVNGGSWTTVQSTSTTVTVSSDGNNTLEYNATDSVGNVEPVQTTYVSLDTVSPVSQNLQDNTSGNTQAGNPVNISIEAQDTYSGIFKARLATNETGTFQNYTTQYGSPVVFSNETNTYKTTAFTWDNNSFDGNLGYKMYVKDAVDNWHETSTGSVYVNRAPNQKNATIKWENIGGSIVENLLFGYRDPDGDSIGSVVSPPSGTLSFTNYTATVTGWSSPFDWAAKANDIYGLFSGVRNINFTTSKPHVQVENTTGAVNESWQTVNTTVDLDIRGDAANYSFTAVSPANLVSTIQDQDETTSTAVTGLVEKVWYWAVDSITSTVFSVKEGVYPTGVQSLDHTIDGQEVIKEKELDNNASISYSRLNVTPPNIVGNCENCGYRQISVSGNSAVNETYNATADFITGETEGTHKIGSDNDQSHTLGTQYIYNQTNFSATNNQSFTFHNVDISSSVPGSPRCDTKTAVDVPSGTNELTESCNNNTFSNDYISSETESSFNTAQNESKSSDTGTQYFFNQTNLSVTNSKSFQFDSVDISSQCSATTSANVPSGTNTVTNNCNNDTYSGDFVDDQVFDFAPQGTSAKIGSNYTGDRILELTNNKGFAWSSLGTTPAVSEPTGCSQTNNTNVDLGASATTNHTVEMDCDTGSQINGTLTKTLDVGSDNHTEYNYTGYINISSNETRQIDILHDIPKSELTDFSDRSDPPTGYIDGDTTGVEEDVQVSVVELNYSTNCCSSSPSQGLHSYTLNYPVNASDTTTDDGGSDSGGGGGGPIGGDDDEDTLIEFGAAEYTVKPGDTEFEDLIIRNFADEENSVDITKKNGSACSYVTVLRTLNADQYSDKATYTPIDPAPSGGLFDAETKTVDRAVRIELPNRSTLELLEADSPYRCQFTAAADFGSAEDLVVTVTVGTTLRDRLDAFNDWFEQRVGEPFFRWKALPATTQDAAGLLSAGDKPADIETLGEIPVPTAAGFVAIVAILFIVGIVILVYRRVA